MGVRLAAVETKIKKKWGTGEGGAYRGCFIGLLLCIWLMLSCCCNCSIYVLFQDSITYITMSKLGMIRVEGEAGKRREWEEEGRKEQQNSPTTSMRLASLA